MLKLQGLTFWGEASKWTAPPRPPRITAAKAFDNFNLQGLRMILSEYEVCGLKSVEGVP